MADRTFANIANALATVFKDDVTNQINRAVVLSQLLEVRPGTGKNITWDAKFGNAEELGTVVIADGADVTAFNNDDKVPATLNYGTYHDAFAITGKAAAAAAAAGNPSQLADLFGDDMMDSVQRLARGIAAHTYTGSGATDNIHGLTAAAGPLRTTGTYANINRATYAQWASNETDALGGALSFANMRAMRRAIYNACGEEPDLIIGDAEQHENYGLLFGDQRRYIQEVSLANGKKIALDGGYRALEFDGIPFIQDAQCPANEVLFLNTRHLYLSQLPDPLDAFKQSSGTAALAGTNEEQFGDSPIGLTARIIPLAKNGDKYSFELICYPQLVSRRNNCHGRLHNLA